MHATWDGFIDALDRAGQCGSAEAIEVPSALDIAGIADGTRFGDLTSSQVVLLVRFAARLGRRSDVVNVLWRDMRNRQRRNLTAARRKARTDERRARRAT
jgi:hypothetical protein